MIRDLSETLKAILTQPGLPAELASAQISFDRPAEPFNPATTTVNLFLFDVRENADLRDNVPVVERRNGEAVIHPPPLRVLCSYLVTAWPSGGTELPLQEHRLLAQVLRALARVPVIPASLAKGSLKTSDPPVPLDIAASNSAINSSEFWSSLGAKLRPSLTLHATLAVPVFDDEPAQKLARAIGVVSGERLPHPLTALDPASREQVEAQFLFGRVVRADGQPVAGADVLLVERGVGVRTADDGTFRLGPLPAGNYTVRAAAGALAAEVSRAVPVPPGNYDIPLA